MLSFAWLSVCRLKFTQIQKLAASKLANNRVEWHIQWSSSRQGDRAGAYAAIAFAEAVGDAEERISLGGHPGS